MSQFSNNRRMKLKTKIWLMMSALLLVMLAIDITISYRKMKAELWSEISTDARDIYGMMMATRRVYQKAFIKSKLEVTDDTLALLPAHSVPRVSQEFSNWSTSGIIFNNVSDQPRNPNNLADEFEMASIDWFRTNPAEKEQLRRITGKDDTKYLLYTAPIWTEAYCLKCHGDPEDAPQSIRDNYDQAFGYKTGELRGIASIRIPTGKFDNRLARVWGSEVIKSLIVYAILFIALGVTLERLVLRRLAQLRAGAENIADGEYSARIVDQGRDEIRRVADSFNLMADKVQVDITNRISAEKKLRENHDRLLAFMEAIPDAVFVKDGEGRWQLANQTAVRMFQLDTISWQNQTEQEMSEHISTFREFLANCTERDESTWRNGSISVNHQAINGPDNLQHTLEVRRTPVFGEQGERSALVTIARDITQRMVNEEKIRKLSMVVEQSPESIVITNLDGSIEYVNQCFIDNSGYRPEELLGKNPRMLKSGKTPHATYQTMWSTLLRGEIWSGELINRRKDGSEFIELATIAPVRETDGQISHYVAIKQDITEQKQAQEQIHRLAYIDGLTGLPNRTLLMDRLAQLVAASRRSRQTTALLLLNIDRFKTINNAQGMDAGDELLTSLARRIQDLLRDGDTFARLSADEFAILLPNLENELAAASRHSLSVAEKIRTAVSKPFILDNQPISVTLSLGIALFPESPDDDVPEVIMRRANTALHRAKDNGGNQSSFFESEMGEKAEQQFRIERELRIAIETGELRLYLQSQVNGDGQITGAEALVRWEHPERGLLPPGVFIPVAEKSDLIIDLDSWVLIETCELMARENMAGHPLRVSVNLSPRHFRQPGFVPWIRDLLTTTGVDPTRLTLEVTEGLFITDINDTIIKMSELCETGIHFSLDDFGTGYSSLSYLKRLPIQELKIDRVFVQDAPTDPDDAALVETILAVAENMHLRVVAEGVETPEQAAFFNNRESMLYQGYLYGKPTPAETWVQHWLETLA
ncbi:MAG: GGDEF domain-containing protein [Sedimenticola sp.]|nr:MAG: GGDEF domain-containing protein [Sedimenticola sp.]